MSFEYLPGIQVSTQDRGLATRKIPTSKITVVVGTSGRGPADVPYQVEDRAKAVQIFGLEGSLVRTMEELSQTGCDNVVLFRIGTKPMTVSNIGEDSGSGEPGFSVLFSRRQADALQRYRLYYETGRLDIWFDGQLVYSNDPMNAVDLGEVEVTGTATGGTAIKQGTGTGYAASVTIDYISQNTGTGQPFEGVSVVSPVTGLQMTKRQLYLALQKAYDLLSIMQVQRIVVPDAVIDNPNVAFYRSSDAATAKHNPASNPDALDWLKTSYDADGEAVYHWASETVNSAGQAVAAQTFSTAAARLAAGYHEVNFGYQLARFCSVQSENLGGCLGFIGVTPPTGFTPRELRRWVGKSPAANDNGVIVTAGSGLAGIPYLSGAPSSMLNPLCHDAASYRKPGFFMSADPASPTKKGEYDMPSVMDENGYPVDIGAYIHVVAAIASVTNGVGTYINNLAAIACGITSVFDDKEALTNKPAIGCAQIYRLGMNELDLLTKAKVNELRFRGLTQLPVFVHDRTAADSESDYIFLQRQQIKFTVVDAVYKEAEPFIGQSTTDGLQLAALKTALERRATELAKRGYVSNAEFSIMSTEADRRIGRAYIDVKFNPADQVVQLRARVAISR